MEESDGIMVVPRGDREGELRFDVRAVVKAQERLREVASVTSGKAPELLDFYNRTWLEISRNVALLKYHRIRAEDRVKAVRGEALLRATDEALAARGHARPSADLRQALVDLDPEVASAKEALNKIEATLDYLRDKARAFENGFTAVKRILQSGAPQMNPLNSPRYPEVRGVDENDL